jgi:hypothetical protein
VRSWTGNLTLEIPGVRGLGSEPFVALFLNEISKIQKVVQKISKWSQDLKSVGKHHILSCETLKPGFWSILGQVSVKPPQKE